MGIHQPPSPFSGPFSDSKDPKFTDADGKGWSITHAVDWAGKLSSSAGDNEKGALLNFLSLYNLTVGDSNAANNNGSWEEIAVKNGDAVRAALFGGGTQATSLINHLYIGDSTTAAGGKDKVMNSLPEINTVLDRLGISADQYNAHENHFHVDFRNPQRVAITPVKPLMVDNNRLDAQVEVVDSYLTLTQTNLDQFASQIATELGVNKEELSIFMIDMPDSPQQYQIAMVAPSSISQENSGQGKQRAFGICLPVNYRDSEAYTSEDYFSPERGFRNYLARFEPTTQAPAKNYLPRVELLESPKHGEIIDKVEDGHTYRIYAPDIGYLGDDQVIYQVTYEGKTIKIVYVLKVTKYLANANDSSHIICKDNDFWKISSLPTGTGTGTDSTTITYSNLINSAVDAIKGFSDLPAGEVGNTTGEGANASITLDTNAAGYGWFIDQTPLSNEEFLPTADANNLKGTEELNFNHFLFKLKKHSTNP